MFKNQNILFVILALSAPELKLPINILLLKIFQFVLVFSCCASSLDGA